MLAGVYSGIGRVECRKVRIPAITEDEILLRVRAAAICGTDLRIYKSGHHRINEGETRILGHELSGEIWKVGRNVTGYRKGMRVAVAPNISCGSCRYCRRGRQHLCDDYDAFGITLDGGFALYMRVTKEAIEQGCLVFVSESVSFEELCLSEPLACTYYAYRSVDTKPGDDVLIVGAGPMGVLHLKMQRLAGAGKVMMADISDSRLALVERFGPDALIRSGRVDLVGEVKRLTGGLGADVIITACPAGEIQKQALYMASKNGRINLFGGLPKNNETVELNTNLIHYNSLVVTGTSRYAQDDFYKSVKLITEGRVELAPIISRRFGIENIVEAFEYAQSGEGLKTLIEFP
ncbi:MAG: zinc-dependent dehydrogenase [Spirochaetes bacterium]|nr:zinc-dependent dehydrogenase [Spirochaetota bacterium]